MPEEVVGVTARMYAFKHGNAEKHFRVRRGIEIQQYLDEHQDIDNYIILDDDCDMLISQSPNFIQTDAKEGISEKDVERAIQILNHIKSKESESNQVDDDAAEMEEEICNNCITPCNYHLYVHLRGHSRTEYKGECCDELKERLRQP